MQNAMQCGWAAVGSTRLLSQLRLNLSHGLLNFSLDLLTGIASCGAENLVRLALSLLDFPGGLIFTSHEDLLVGGQPRFNQMPYRSEPDSQNDFAPVPNP